MDLLGYRAVGQTERCRVRKLPLLAGVVAAGSAVAAFGMGAGHADPGTMNLLNVVGEPYAKAVAILRAQGVAASFGGSVGSDVPQAQCIVSSQKVIGRKMQLMLDCTTEAQGDLPTASGPAAGGTATSGAATSGSQAPNAGGRPTPGAPGVVTVIPTRVG